MAEEGMAEEQGMGRGGPAGAGGATGPAGVSAVMGPAGDSAATLMQDWHHLHPLSPVVRSVRGLGALLIALAYLGLSRGRRGGSADRTDIYVDLAILALVIVAGIVSWLVTRWRVETRHLVVETGLLRRQSKRVPLDRLQAVDIVRPGPARVLGLSELRVRVGGASASDARLAYLPEREAAAIRAQLLAISHGVHRRAAPPPERLLLRLAPSQLVAGVALETGTLAALAAIGTLVAVGAAVPGSQGSLAGLVPLLIALGGVLWRRLGRSWGFEVAQAPDGLRIRTGLVNRASETIPSGRIQAVRQVEPLLWRPLGWARLEVDVSGRQRREREDADVGRQRRVVLPVGPAPTVAELLALAAPRAPLSSNRPPWRAALKAPLSYHLLSGGVLDGYAMSTEGRLRKVTTWVPLVKIQSVRLTQGPVQRRLDLASVHADAAGRGTVAVLKDRAASEAAPLSVRLADGARAARRRASTAAYGQPEGLPSGMG
jgi:putative membrane protein